MEYRTYLKNIQIDNFYSCIKCKGIKSDKTNLVRYGCKNVFQNENIKTKIKEKLIIRYGVDNVSKSTEIKNKKIKTNREHWGTDWGLSSPIVIDKRNKNNLLKYGCENVFQTEEIKERSKKTNMKKYGVEHIMQNEDMYKNFLRISKEVHMYNDTNLHYQSSYEKDFLDKYYNIFDIKNGFPIIYELDNKAKTYYPDFYLSEFNLIIEIKSDRWYNLFIDKNLAKQKKCLSDGYNFLFVVNKNYDEFRTFVGC